MCGVKQYQCKEFNGNKISHGIYKKKLIQIILKRMPKGIYNWIKFVHFLFSSTAITIVKTELPAIATTEETANTYIQN